MRAFFADDDETMRISAVDGRDRKSLVAFANIGMVDAHFELRRNMLSLISADKQIFSTTEAREFLLPDDTRSAWRARPSVAFFIERCAWHRHAQAGAGVITR